MAQVTVSCNLDLLPIVEEIEKRALMKDAMDFQDMATTDDLDQLERELYSKGETE